MSTVPNILPPPPPPPLAPSTAAPSTPTTSTVNEDEERFRNSPTKWYFPKSKFDMTPSRRAGVDAEKELGYRQSAACFIQEMGQKLKVNQLCINTAIVYMNRFYMFHSFPHFHRNSISVAAIFLAAKVEEQPRKLEHVVRVSHHIQFRNTEPMLDPKSETYQRLCQELVMNENILLQTLGFNLAVDHPHTHIIKCCQLVRASKDLGQSSYLLATNILHLTTMCVQYRPTLVAALAIHVACKWSGWAIPRSKEGKDWWKYVDSHCTYQELEELTQEYLEIYNKAPPRLKLKVASFSSMKSSSSTSSTSSQVPNQPPSQQRKHPVPPHHQSGSTSSGSSSGRSSAVPGHLSSNSSSVNHSWPNSNSHPATTATGQMPNALQNHRPSSAPKPYDHSSKERPVTAQAPLTSSKYPVPPRGPPTVPSSNATDQMPPMRPMSKPMYHPPAPKDHPQQQSASQAPLSNHHQPPPSSSSVHMPSVTINNTIPQPPLPKISRMAPQQPPPAPPSAPPAIKEPPPPPPPMSTNKEPFSIGFGMGSSNNAGFSLPNLSSLAPTTIVGSSTSVTSSLLFSNAPNPFSLLTAATKQQSSIKQELMDTSPPAGPGPGATNSIKVKEEKDVNSKDKNSVFDRLKEEEHKHKHKKEKKHKKDKKKHKEKHKEKDRDKDKDKDKKKAKEKEKEKEKERDKDKHRETSHRGSGTTTSTVYGNIHRSQGNAVATYDYVEPSEDLLTPPSSGDGSQEGRDKLKIKLSLKKPEFHTPSSASSSSSRKNSNLRS